MHTVRLEGCLPEIPGKWLPLFQTLITPQASDDARTKAELIFAATLKKQKNKTLASRRPPSEARAWSQCNGRMH